MLISHVVACGWNFVIGKDNQLLWSIPQDLKFFKNLTTNHCILMGRKTYDSIGRVLPNRTNIVVTTTTPQGDIPNGVVYVDNIEEGILYAKMQKETELFIIGGGTIYRQTKNIVDKVYLTLIDDIYEGDTFYPGIPGQVEPTPESRQRNWITDGNHTFSFLQYVRKS
jgi:dihydrofolate reductase